MSNVNSLKFRAKNDFFDKNAKKWKMILIPVPGDGSKPLKKQLKQAMSKANLLMLCLKR